MGLGFSTAGSAGINWRSFYTMPVPRGPQLPVKPGSEIRAGLWYEFSSESSRMMQLVGDGIKGTVKKFRIRGTSEIVTCWKDRTLSRPTSVSQRPFRVPAPQGALETGFSGQIYLRNAACCTCPSLRLTCVAHLGSPVTENC